MVKLICDKCGKEIETTFSLIGDEEIKPYHFGSLGEIEYAFCDNCYDEFVECVGDFVEKNKTNKEQTK